MTNYVQIQQFLGKNGNEIKEFLFASLSVKHLLTPS